MDHLKIELFQLIVIALEFFVIAALFIRSEIRLFYTKFNKSLLVAIIGILRSADTAERDRTSGVGPTDLHCIPTPRSQTETITPLESCWSLKNGYCNGMYCKPNECDMRQA